MKFVLQDALSFQYLKLEKFLIIYPPVVSDMECLIKMFSNYGGIFAGASLWRQPSDELADLRKTFERSR